MSTAENSLDGGCTDTRVSVEIRFVSPTWLISEGSEIPWCMLHKQRFFSLMDEWGSQSRGWVSNARYRICWFVESKLRTHWTPHAPPFWLRSCLSHGGRIQEMKSHGAECRCPSACRRQSPMGLTRASCSLDILHPSFHMHHATPATTSTCLTLMARRAHARGFTVRRGRGCLAFYSAR